MSIPETYKVIVADDNGQAIIKEIPTPKPSTNQVLVKVEFAPINPTDLVKFKGFYGKPADFAASIGGSEGSGTIVAVGDNLKVPYKVGDRVHLTSGTWAQYQLASSEDVSRVLQDDLPLEEAASHWVNPATVYYMGVLADRGGHKAAIHTAASSALGRQLIRYFKHKGIKLINIVRRDEYIEELKKEGADYVLNSQAPDFEAQLKEVVQKENVTVAFDAVAGDSPNILLGALPRDSTCYIYGVLSGFGIGKVNRVNLMSNKKLAALFLPDYMNERKEKNEFDQFRDEVHSLLPTLLRTNVHKVFSFEEITDAIAYYDKNSSKGKILLKFN